MAQNKRLDEHILGHLKRQAKQLAGKHTSYKNIGKPDRKIMNIVEVLNKLYWKM